MALTYVKASGIDITGNYTVNSIDASANVTAGNVKTDNILYANGTAWSFGGTYSNTNVANYLPTYTGNLVALTGPVTTTANVTANYFIGNGSQLTGLPASYSNTNVASYLPTYTGNVSANYFIGNGSTLTFITGANVTGYVPNASNANSATTAGTVTTANQSNITNVGTLLGLSVTGNVDVTGNINVTGNLNYSNVSDLVVGDPLIYIGANNTGNLYDLGIVASYNDGTYYHTGLARDATDGIWKLFDGVVAEPTTVIDFANATYPQFKSGAITSTGNITAVNANLGNLVVANYFSGNGSLLSSITGSNVSGNVNYAITSNYANTANSVAGANVTGQVSNALIAGTVYTNAQPNITSVGTLSSLTVSANITSGNASLGNLATSNYFSGNGSLLTSITGANVTGYVSNASNANSATTAGTVTTASQPNITSLGTLTGLTSNGIVDFTNTSNLTIGNVSNLHILGGSNNYVLSTDGSGTLSWVAQSGGGGSVAGSNTQLQFNDSNSFGASANLTFDKGTKILTTDRIVVSKGANLGSNVSNVYIGGGSNQQILSTDGAGNLTWIAQPVASITVDNFTGNGVQTTFTLSTTPSNIGQTIVNYNGALQLRNAYSLSGANITFTEAPANSSSIEVTTTLGCISGSGAFVTRTYTGDGSTANYTVTNGTTVSSTIVTENGLVQTPTTDYTISGSTLTFTSAPANSVAIQIRELAIAVASSSTPSSLNAAIANVIITGGSNGQALTTDGSGTLSWSTVASSGPSNARVAGYSLVFGG